MASLNKVSLIGRLGKDPDVRQLEGGRTIVSFVLATSEKYTNAAGEKVEETEWHNVVCAGKLAQIAPYIHKGSNLYVEGKIKTRSWMDQNQQQHYRTEIIALGAQLLDPRPQQQAQPAYQQPAPAPAPAPAPPVPPRAPVPPAPAPAAPAYSSAPAVDDLPF